MSKPAKELEVSETRVQRMLRYDLGCQALKKKIESSMSDVKKGRRKASANWIQTNFSEEQTLKFSVSDEKMFDLDGMCNAENDRIWAVSGPEADERSGLKQKWNSPKKVMVWLGACSKGLTPLVILDKRTVDHKRYIRDVLSVHVKYENDVFGGDWIFQQESATSHTQALIQQWM
jgi:hypothetical protein